MADGAAGPIEGEHAGWTRGKQGQPAPGLGTHTGANGRVVESSTACQTPFGRKPSRVGRVGGSGEHVMHADTTRKGANTKPGDD